MSWFSTELIVGWSEWYTISLESFAVLMLSAEKSHRQKGPEV